MTVAGPKVRHLVASWILHLSDLPHMCACRARSQKTLRRVLRDLEAAHEEAVSL